MSVYLYDEASLHLTVEAVSKSCTTPKPLCLVWLGRTNFSNVVDRDKALLVMESHCIGLDIIITKKQPLAR